MNGHSTAIQPQCTAIATGEGESIPPPPGRRFLLAIDPGGAGGLAWCDAASGGTVTARAMPDTEGGLLMILRDIVAEAGNPAMVAAFVEQVGGYVRTEGGQPGSAMFKFGRGFGFLLGACAGMGIPVDLVPPQRWQRGIATGVRAGLSKPDWKRKLKAQAERLFPGLRVTLATADALVMLEWARRLERMKP
jgi:hypothetical protein